MKIFPRIFILFSAAFLFSCSSSPEKKVDNKKNEPNDTTEKTEVIKGEIKKIYCDGTPYSYEIYIPKSLEGEKKYPVMFMFDSHAAGFLPLKKYSEIAEKNKIILACSDDSKNGLPFDEYSKIINSFFTDVIKKFQVDTNNVYAGGFSGGARIAGFTGMNETIVKGVILNSAGVEFRGINPNKKCVVALIAGSSDFNLFEIYNSMDNLLSSAKNITPALFTFNGKHDWAPAEIFDSALQFIIYSEQMKIQAGQAFQKFKKNHAAEFAEEKRLHEIYSKAISEKNFDWWKMEIEKIYSLKKEDKTKEELCQRLLQYLSISCYSYCNQSLKNGIFEPLLHFTKIYELADPENAEWAYLRAIGYASIGDRKTALELLHKTAALGFNDKQRALKEISFKEYYKEPDFQKFLNEIKPMN